MEDTKLLDYFLIQEDAVKDINVTNDTSMYDPLNEDGENQDGTLKYNTDIDGRKCKVSFDVNKNPTKKAIKHGFELKAIYSPALFHIFHGKGGGGFLDGINRKVNDMYRAVTAQEKTENADTWGFEPIEMEYELLFY